MTHSSLLSNINTNIVFNITLIFTRFLYIGKIIYTTIELRNPITFLTQKATYSNITFTPRGLIFYLKFSKTNKQHYSVNITITAIGSPLCPVAAMTKLFNRDPQPPDSPLFYLNNKPFTTPAARKILSSCLITTGITLAGYSNYSFY